MSRWLEVASILAASLVIGTGARPAGAQAGGGLPIESCPQTAPSTDFRGDKLNLLTELKDGVVYDDTGAVGLLRLKKEGGVFKSSPLGISDTTVFAAVADFDGDGWDDFVGGGEGTQFLRVYRNFSFQNLPVDWSNPNTVLPPKFQSVRELYPAYPNVRWHVLAAGDFDGDGKPDIFWSNAYQFNRPYDSWIWLNNGNDVSGNPTFKTRYSGMAAGTSPTMLGAQTWGGTNVAVVDYNGDRKLDLLVGSGETNGGAIRIFLNDCTLMNPQPTPLPAAGKPLRCANRPHFAYAGYLVRDLGLGTGRGNLPVFSYNDFDGDGLRDLVVGAPACCRRDPLRVFKGQPGGGVEQTFSQSISWPGAATTVLEADFSLDGKPDLLVGADNWNYDYGRLGGLSYYYRNNGTSAAFSGGPTQTLTTQNNPTYDFDVGFVFNYDNDPDHTPDVMIADGNHSASFYVLANRTVTSYVSCGDVASGVLDLGSLSNTEMVVTAARLKPTYQLNGGSIQFFMSNEEPPNWQPAVDCGDGSGDVCTSFAKPVGRQVRWKATICSNSYHTQTPQLFDLDMSFDYTKAAEHYRAGVVVNDGVAYVGAFRQPGDRGHFYALNAGLTTTYWDAATRLDAMSDGSRQIYTADANGSTRLDFSAANAGDPTLQSTLQTADTQQTIDVINWIRSPRFGVGNQGISLSRLGAVETSTPAVVTRPGLPLWYTHASPAEKTVVDDFISSHASRPIFALFGSKDGMIHAVRNDPSNITDPQNGTEAWAFVPPTVASRMVADYANSLGGSLSVKAFPDGSPTVADVMLSDGKLHTVAVVGGANGDKSFVAMEVGDSIAAGGVVNGPTPLWSRTPGGDSAGQAYSKAAFARVKIRGQEQFIAIVGSGVAYDDTTAPYTKGLMLHAYDIATGALLWKFETLCPVTSDIVTFETDDNREAGAPRIDGYTDRAIFSDSCGYVYKVDPARDLGGGWNVNAGMGTIPARSPSGNQLFALFSTRDTRGALGFEAPVAGTLAARPDASTRMVLFFGTGGIEGYDPSKVNQFYAVYADNGEIRSKHVGRCAGGRCEKFYGGAVVTNEQVIFSGTIDPAVGTNTCDPGETTIYGFRLNPDAAGDFVGEFSQPVASAVMGAMYGDAGAIYFATLSGDVVRIGSPRATEAGGDSSAGNGGGISNGGDGGALLGSALTIMGWRQVF